MAEVDLRAEVHSLLQGISRSLNEVVVRFDRLPEQPVRVAPNGTRRHGISTTADDIVKEFNDCLHLEAYRIEFQSRWKPLRVAFMPGYARGGGQQVVLIENPTGSFQSVVLDGQRAVLPAFEANASFALDLDEVFELVRAPLSPAIRTFVQRVNHPARCRLTSAGLALEWKGEIVIGVGVVEDSSSQVS
jgi:hypothetical protein